MKTHVPQENVQRALQRNFEKNRYKRPMNI